MVIFLMVKIEVVEEFLEILPILVHHQPNSDGLLLSFDEFDKS